MKKGLLLIGILSAFGVIYNIRRKKNKGTSSEQIVYARDGYIIYND